MHYVIGIRSDVTHSFKETKQYKTNKKHTNFAENFKAHYDNYDS